MKISCSFKKHYLTVLIFLLLLPVISADSFYGDISIYVDDSGLTTIKGDTDYEEIFTDSDPSYTSKKGEYWIFNISVPVDFDPLIYSLTLPRGADVNYIRVPELGRIEHSDSGLMIIGTVEKKKFFVVVQYKINRKQKMFPLLWIGVILSGLFLLLLSAMLSRRFSKNNPESSSKNALKETDDEQTRHFLSERQKKILSLVEKEKDCTQKSLEKLLGMPKSSLSRNIASLERMGFIEKDKAGMSNIIRKKRAS